MPIQVLIRQFGLCGVGVFLFHSLSFGQQIQVVDQWDKPVANAVVSVAVAQPQERLSNPAIMDQVNKQFLPNVLIVNKDQWVKFPNSDDIRHHIYSFSAPKPFEIRMYKGGETKTVQFDQAGIVVLGCNIHDSMIGYIYVAEDEVAVLTNAEGKAELPVSASRLNLWHADLSRNHADRQTYTLEQPAPVLQVLHVNLLANETRVKRSVKKFQSKGE